MKLNEKIQTLAGWMYESRYLVVFTGAGISTESGLPDFRGPDGVWTRRDKGLPPKPIHEPWDKVEPNTGHLAITELQRIGKLKFLISQNVDNLHQRAGSSPDRIIEIHGTACTVKCLECEAKYDRDEIEKRLLERYNVKNTNVSTFHKLGKDILEEARSKYQHAEIVNKNKKHEIPDTSDP